jgi:four helix bundle protein
MNKFKDLIVWQKAVELATEIYKTTKAFPSEEKYGLTVQMNRCAISIASNIAEGAGRNSENEFRHFLGIATGSVYELETQLVIANNLKYITIESLVNFEEKINEIQRLIGGLSKSLKNKNIK